MPSNLESTEAVSSMASDVEVTDAENLHENADGGEGAQESSTGADAKESVTEENWDPLSVVKKAVDKDKGDSDAADGDQSRQTDKSSKSESGNQKAEGAEADGELGEITEEELKSYKPQTRKRIEKLLDDRARLNERVEALSPAAEQMEALQNFMQERQLTPAHVSELMVVGGLAMSSDPKDLRQALNRVDQFRNQIASQLGDVLPDDLQRKVDEGLLDAETAKGVALERVDAQRNRVQAERANATVETTQTQAQTERDNLAAQVVHATISDWQKHKAETDPDYSRKAELLQKEIRLRVQAEGGRVLDKAKALQIANEAYADVTRIVKSLSPTAAPVAKRVLQSKAPPGNMASKPNSALDAAKQGLYKGR